MCDRITHNLALSEYLQASRLLSTHSPCSWRSNAALSPSLPGCSHYPRWLAASETRRVWLKIIKAYNNSEALIESLWDAWTFFWVIFDHCWVLLFGRLSKSLVAFSSFYKDLYGKCLFFMKNFTMSLNDLLFLLMLSFSHSLSTLASHLCSVSIYLCVSVSATS